MRYGYRFGLQLIRMGPVWVAGTATGYVLAFFLFYPISGAGTVYLATVPVLVAGRCYGSRAGLLAGILSSLSAMVLLMAVGISDAYTLTAYLLPVFVVVKLTGWMVGRLHDTAARAQRELLEYRQLEGELRVSEERYRALYDDTPSMYFTVDAAGMVVSVNQFGAAYLGYTPEELTGQTVLRVFVEADRAAASQHVAECLAHPGQVFEWELCKIRKDGSVLWVKETARAVQNAQGSNVVTIVCEDITARKRAEEAATEEHRLLRTLIDHLPDVIFVKDVASRFLLTNQALSSMAGVSGDKLIGKTDFDFFPASVAAQFYADEQSIIKSGQPMIGKEELIYTHRPGSERWFSTTRVPLQDSQGRIKGIVGIGRDITERKQMELALQKAHDELERRVEERTAELRKANEQLAALYRVAQAMTTPLRLDVVLDVIARSTAQLLETDTGVILLVDFDTETLTIKGAYGLSERVVRGTRDRIGESIAGRVVQTGEPIIANDLPNDARFDNPSASEEGWLACASVPLAMGTRIIGTLDVHSKTSRHAFTIEHIEMLNLLASQAVIAIENARLYEELQRAHADLEQRVQQRTAELVAANEQLQTEIGVRRQAEEAMRLSEERYRALYRDNPSMFFTLDTDGVVISVNEFGARQLGYTIAELEGQSVLHVFYEADKPAVREQLKQCLLNPWQVFRWQFRKVRKDGSMLWVEEFARAVNGPDNRLHVLVVCQDITGRKRTEEALQQEEERFRYVSMATRDAIYDWDVRSGTVLRNEAYQTLYSPDEPVGTNLAWWEERVHPDDIKHIMVSIQDAFQTGQRFWANEYRFQRSDDSYATVIDRGYILYDDSGQPLRVIGAMTDISPLRQAEAARLELALAKERTELLKEFLNILSHDLKTPLSIINTSLYLLKKSTDPRHRERKLQQIKMQVQHLEAVIHDILTASRLDTAPELVLEPLTLNQMVVAIQEQLSILADNRLVSLRLDLAPALPPVMASETELNRALVNLIENALNYTPAQGTVTIRTFYQADRIVLEVVDTGIGISETDLPHIFEHFFRTERAKATNTGGSGLGLAIVKKIVEIHHGSIEVESTPGQGSTFRVYLPVAGINSQV